MIRYIYCKTCKKKRKEKKGTNIKENNELRVLGKYHPVHEWKGIQNKCIKCG